MPAARVAKTWVAVVAAAGAVVAAPGALAGCGGGDDAERPSTTATVAAGQAVEVAGGEYFFDPDGIVVEGGPAPLEITLENVGSLAHNLTLFDEGTEVGGTPTFQGGDSRTVTVDLEPGVYRMVCTVADHEALGMVGELEVR